MGKLPCAPLDKAAENRIEENLIEEIKCEF